MKKNLNIAYLNGAEGMIRRGGASSGGSGDSGDIEANAEYYRIDWDKARDKGWITDSTINGEVMTGVISSFEDCRIEIQGMIQYLKLKVLFVSAETQNSLIELITAITKFSFEPHSIKIYQNGSLLMEQKYNTFSDAYPGLSEQGIIFPITKEEFYAV